MAISRDITITVNNNTAKTNKTIYLYLGDGGLILNITVAESNFNAGDFNFTPKNIKNLALSSNSIYASVCIEKPNGDKINSIKYPIINGMFSFEFTKDIIDEMDEVGKYQLQVHMYDSDNLNANRITIPPVALLEVLAPLCKTHNHTFIEGHTEDAKVDKSITASRPLIDSEYDSEGNYNKTTWIEGQIITKEALNKMENVIFDNRRDARKLREDTDGILNSYQTKTDNSLMTTSKEVVGAINENNTRLKELETKNSEQDSKLKDIQTNINTINNKNTEQDSKLKDIQTNINTINNKNSEQDNTLNGIQENINTINDKNSEQDNTLNGIQENINTINDKNSEQDNTLNDIQTNINTINDKNSEQDNTLNGIQENINTINDKNSEQDNTLNDIQTNINTINNKNTEQDNTLNDIQTNINTINNKNTEQDVRLKDVEYKNKVQDTYISGLFNENNDKRLTIEGEGNSLKLEGSKEGLVTVDKVVGNTMVNLYENKSKSFHTDYIHSVNEIVDLNRFVEGREYTAIILSSTSNFNAFRISSGDVQYNLVPITTGKIKKFTYIPPTDNINKNDIRCYYYPTDNKFIQGDEQKVKTLILEGDYTNKPIPSEYFEGMQPSFEECKVTQEMVDSGEELAENLGKYKYEVEVMGKNLLKYKFENGNMGYNGTPSTSAEPSYIRSIDYVPCKGDTDIIVTYDSSFRFSQIFFYDENKNFITRNTVVMNTTPFNTAFVKITLAIKDTSTNIDKALLDMVNTSTMLLEYGQTTSYEPYYHKTKAVYLNSPLYKGDEIVCKEDGLYHYHLMNQIVLDGSDDEKWGMPNSQPDNTSRFYWLNIAPVGVNGANTICDKSPTKSGAMADMLGIWVDANIILNVPKTVTTIDECKLLLSSNPITVVYELKEPYYEKISDDKLLLEIPNSATLSVESVIPCQSISATYTGGIPSVYALEETNRSQDDLIDITLCATDEMYMMIEPLLAQQPQFINGKGVSKMVDMYVAMVIRGLKTIDEVPARYREQVKRNTCTIREIEVFYKYAKKNILL